MIQINLLHVYPKPGILYQFNLDLPTYNQRFAILCCKMPEIAVPEDPYICTHVH